MSQSAILIYLAVMTGLLTCLAWKVSDEELAQRQAAESRLKAQNPRAFELRERMILEHGRPGSRWERRKSKRETKRRTGKTGRRAGEETRTEEAPRNVVVAFVLLSIYDGARASGVFCVERFGAWRGCSAVIVCLFGFLPARFPSVHFFRAWGARACASPVQVSESKKG